MTQRWNKSDVGATYAEQGRGASLAVPATKQRPQLTFEQTVHFPTLCLDAI